MKKASLVIMAALLALASAVLPAWADDAAATATQSEKKAAEKATAEKAVMTDVTVTAKRYQAEEIDTGSFTTVITAKEMEEQGGDNAYQVLQRTGGLTFSGSLPGGISQGGMNGEIGIRGINSGEQVMMNGIPIIEPTAGGYDLDQIPAAFLERIEVVKGANSALYGSRAMTGVINMRTRRPGAAAVGGDLTGGGNGFFEGTGWYRNDLVFLGVNYVGYDDITDAKKNYSKSSPYNTSLLSPQKTSAMASFQPWEPLVFNYMFNYTDAAYKADYYKKPTSSYQVDEKIYHHYVSAVYEKGQLRATAFFNYNYLKTDYDYYGNSAKPGKANTKKSFTTGVDLQDSVTVWDTLLLYGGTYVFEQQDETRQDVTGSASRGYSVTGIDLDNTRHLPSIFVQGERTFWERLILTVGIRGQAVLNTEEDSDDYFEPVPQFQAVYKLNDLHSVYANVGRAFRVPTFNQLYSETATLVGNPELDPEYGWTYEIGYKFELGWFSGTISAFYMDFRDKIRYVLNESDDRYYAQNMDKYQTSGVEWQFALQVHEYVRLTFGGYGADPWEEEDGVREQAGPKWQMVPGVYFEMGPWQLGLNATMLFERERGLDDYVNVHLTGSYQLTDWLKLKVKADNLFNADLAVYGNMTPGYSSPYEVLDPGLWLYGGVEIDFSLL